MQTTLALEGFDELLKDARRAAKAITGEVQRTLREISFAGEGCAISQASASLLTEFVKGKTIKEISGLSESLL